MERQHLVHSKRTTKRIRQVIASWNNSRIKPTRTSTRTKKTVESSVYNSERLLRTETARIQTDVFVYSAKEVGIDQYEWIAEPDACDVCKGLDGKVFNLKNMVIGENGVPKHPNCRCSQALYFDREEWERNN